MPKNLFQDMVRVKREEREARLAAAPSGARARPKEPPGHFEAKAMGEEPRVAVKKETKKIPPERRPARGSRRALWLVAFVSVLFFLFALSFLFAKAEVKVTPKVKDLVLNDNFGASKGAKDSLSFDTVVISGEESKPLELTNQKQMSQKASGVVVLYNNFSSAPQVFSVETRLEGSNGKIYKTAARVTLPGLKAGKPGSAEVKIYGSAAGPEYNSPPLDFKILGFKGTPKYTKFYGRSKGGITGGVNGKFFVLTDAEKQTFQSVLEANLRTKLLQKATSQIPSGFILFKDAAFLNVDEQNLDTPSATASFQADIKGTFYGILFEEKKLTQKIASSHVEKYDGTPVYISNIRDLVFSLETNVSNFADLTDINFHLSGPAKVVWKVDQAKLISDLLGQSKKNFNQILTRYPDIDSASLVLSPLWSRSIPSKTKNVKITVNYPQ